MKTVTFAALGVVVSISAAGADELGQASYYANPQHSGMIAAHKTLPFGTRVRVTRERFREFLNHEGFQYYRLIPTCREDGIVHCFGDRRGYGEGLQSGFARPGY
jgi:hypothetical protein